MRIDIPAKVERIIELLHEAGFEAYVVGGCVRDSILNRVPGDWDITTNALPKDIKRVFRKTIDTGIEHGTVTVLMGGEGFEVTTYRLDGDYSDKRHPDKVTFTSDLKEDLLRRDFTINAMAYADDRGIVDEFGGLDDLKAGIIRCVGDPDARFDEDALRILRAMRFSAQLGFTIEPETLKAMQTHASDLQYVSKERIFTELNKTIDSAHPERIKLLWELGIAQYICESFMMIKPDEATGQDGACQNGAGAGHYASWQQLMRHLSGEDAEKILRELKSDNDTIHMVRTLVDEYKKLLDTSEYGVRKKLSQIGPELYDKLVELKRTCGEVEDSAVCDRAAAVKKMILERGDCYSLKQLAVGGRDLMALGIQQGPRLGEILEALLEEVLKDPEMNDRDKLIEIVPVTIRNC